MVNVGTTAPQFTLKDTDRVPRSLGEFAGKKLLLAFYPGAFTGVCDKEMCTLRDSMAEFNSLEAEVIGISVDSPYANKAFKEKYQIAFPLLSDFDRSVIRMYGVELQDFGGLAGYSVAQRSVFILDREGKVTWKWVAERPGIEPNYPEVREALAKA